MKSTPISASTYADRRDVCICDVYHDDAFMENNNLDAIAIDIAKSTPSFAIPFKVAAMCRGKTGNVDNFY